VTGAPLIGGWIAHLAFWAILVIGIVTNGLRTKTAGVVVALWIAGYAGLPYLATYGGFFVTPYVAVLDVILALAVFGGDVRLT
jgi:hypothetical protein